MHSDPAATLGSLVAARLQFSMCEACSLLDDLCSRLHGFDKFHLQMPLEFE